MVSVFTIRNSTISKITLQTLQQKSYIYKKFGTIINYLPIYLNCL